MNRQLERTTSMLNFLRQAFRSAMLSMLEMGSGAALWGIVALLSLGAIERNVFGTSNFGNADDLVAYSSAILFSFGLALGLARGVHVSIDILDKWFQGRLRGAFRLMIRILGILSGFILSYGAVALCTQSYERKRIYYGSIAVDAWIIQLILVIGCLAFLYEFVFGKEEKDAEFSINN